MAPPSAASTTSSSRTTARPQVDITVNRPLHQGTTAIVRATSLSGIANRYVSLQPGPDNNPELGHDATITEVDTTSPVDLDQLFNTLRGPERQALRNVIQGSATVYAGNGPAANQTYKYLSPSLVATDRLLQELDRDQGTLTDFLVNGASVVSAVAQRRADLSALTQNANVALGAIANENRSFDQALVALPGTLRQANTTFHNLRPALDDLDVAGQRGEARHQEPAHLPPRPEAGRRPGPCRSSTTSRRRST